MLQFVELSEFVCESLLGSLDVVLPEDTTHVTRCNSFLFTHIVVLKI